MTIDVYTNTGEKNGSMELPGALFNAEVNEGLMHEALVRQQSNRRTNIAHVKTRSEVIASTRKLYQQKGTGRARRGSASANLLKGGAKAFGPRNDRNFTKQMPKTMRRRALFSCLSYAAKSGKIIGLENYGSDAKTKTFINLLSKLPVAIGRKIVFVLPAHIEALERGSCNVPGVKTLLAQYLNPEDVLGAHHIVFLVEAVRKVEEIFGRRLSKLSRLSTLSRLSKNERESPVTTSKTSQTSKASITSSSPAQ